MTKQTVKQELQTIEDTIEAASSNEEYQDYLIELYQPSRTRLLKRLHHKPWWVRLHRGLYYDTG